MSAPKKLRGDWAAFVAAVEGRLEKGARAYGDGSLAKHPRGLANEIEEELLDVAGWGFLLWRRMQGLQNRLPNPRRRRGGLGRGIVRGVR